MPPIVNCDSGVCQQAMLTWWSKCKQLSAFNQQLTNFYDRCQELSQPNCGTCRGHATAKVALSTDARVLTAGSSQRAAFTSQFVGEMANLLCVPSMQV